MSGEMILIEQLRADVERLRERAEKAERERSECIVEANRQVFRIEAELRDASLRAEKAEREIERLRSDAKTLAAEHFAADYRAAIARADKAEDERDEAIARAEKAERERDEARAERDARPDISVDDAALHTGAVTFAESVRASQRIHVALRAHAAKAVKP